MQKPATGNVIYSTLSTEAVISAVAAAYDVGDITRCEFLARGLNDSFLVKTADRSYVFRIYRHGWRTQPQIQYELELLLYLDRKRIGVSTPLARKDRAFAESIAQPEGQRYGVLFTFAEGRQTGAVDEAHARLFGSAAAALHAASDDFVSSHPRFKIDLSHLIDQPLTTIPSFLAQRTADQDYLRELAAKVRGKIESLQAELDFGFCHGDLHGSNAAFQDDRVTMFDFDCCGVGWRAYDVAVFRWIMDIRKNESAWKSFIESYQERRPLSADDLAAVPLFVAARYIWLMGLHTALASSIGTSALGEQYWDYWLKLLREWDAKEL